MTYTGRADRLDCGFPSCACLPRVGGDGDDGGGDDGRMALAVEDCVASGGYHGHRPQPPSNDLRFLPLV